MCELREQPPARQRKMPSLRKRLTHPATYLAGVAVVLALATLDSCRSPGLQLTGRVYVSLVQTYQRFGRPMLKGHVQCRFHPSCSDYSIEAVQRYGIRHGLVLTFSRIQSCTSNVPLGTADPVPSQP
jgi:putative membrane protein insertion efficiency factor